MKKKTKPKKVLRKTWETWSWPDALQYRTVPLFWSNKGTSGQVRYRVTATRITSTKRKASK